MCIHIYIYIYVYHVYTHMYKYRERERCMYPGRATRSSTAFGAQGR